MIRRPTVIVLLLAGAAALAGCGGGGGTPSVTGDKQAVSCPAAWNAGWQRLADDVGAPVYCPSWMPQPLTGEIGGPYTAVDSVDVADRSYLVGFFLYDESSVTHVNLRGYPGLTGVPVCRTVQLRAGQKHEGQAPCFSKREEVKRIGGLTVTVYMRNRDADDWHVLYAWRHKGSLYTISEHVGYPWSYRKVEDDLDRIVRSLALVTPRRVEN